ncbi:cyclic nucleotide phosphodiesterase [Holotrichia oblita]|nr:cyclic nucleotide phosphodiesterase [Holotrichia oblita]
MQYVNSAAETYFGYRYEELLGKTLHEQLTTDPMQINVMSAKLLRGRLWSGHLTLKRKTLETVTVMCSAIPVNCGARFPTHFALVIDCGTIAIDLPRGSTTNLKRNSIDIRSVSSDYNRRTSIAKLSALPLEAPITKVTQDSAGSNNQLVGTLDKVIEMLRCTELYSPQMKADNRVAAEEPVATDLIGALISMPTQIRDLLEGALAWDFDVIRLEDLSNKRPLLYLGMHIMLHFDVPGTLNIDERILYNFLMLIESKYHADNSYHNSSHAADVMQSVACYLERDRLKAIMDPLDEAVSLIAAACHDVDHPGRSSAFLSNCDNPLAVLYNDITVLENHHAALTFKLALGDDRVNIFKNLDRDTYKVVRQNIVDMILATEMTKHFEHLAKFVNVFSVKSSLSIEHEETQGDYVPIALPENVLLVKRMMIKCADVSNPTRPLRLCVEWARRITEEYFQQTDEEKAKGLPVLMPMFDRTTCSIPKAQIGFVDFIINDMVEAWNGFIDFPELVTFMRQNYLKWKEYDEKGFTTLTDIKKLQTSGLSPSSSSTPTVAE